MTQGRGTRAAPGAWPAPSPGDAAAPAETPGLAEVRPRLRRWPQWGGVGEGFLTGLGGIWEEQRVPGTPLVSPALGKGGGGEWGGRSSSGDEGERSQGRAPST